MSSYYGPDLKKVAAKYERGVHPDAVTYPAAPALAGGAVRPRDAPDELDGSPGTRQVRAGPGAPSGGNSASEPEL